METRKVVLIVIFALICVLSICNVFVSPVNNYKTVTVNDVEVSVPNNNCSVVNRTDHFSYYEDMAGGVMVYVFNSRGSNLTDVKEMFNFITVRDVNQIEVIPVEEEEYSFNYSSSLNEYTCLINVEDRNVFVITKNEDDMIRVLESLKVKSDDVGENSSSGYQERIVEDTVNFHPTF